MYPGTVSCMDAVFHSGDSMNGTTDGNPQTYLDLAEGYEPHGSAHRPAPERR
jgi:hypothetical protein